MPNVPSNSSESATTTTTTVADETTTTTTTHAPAESKPTGAEVAVSTDKVLGDETKTPEQLGDEARAEALENHRAEHARDGEPGRSKPASI